MRKIHNLPISLRPREKLLQRGVEALTSEELFAVILVTGAKKQSVSQLASRISKLFSKSHDLTRTSLGAIGLGPAKIAQVLAAIELGKRLSKKDVVLLTSPDQIFAHSQEIIQKEKESLLCFYLNARGELLKKEVVAVGSLNRASILPREIFIPIKELPVSDIILVHNHPSGSLEPSKNDLLFTKRVKRAGEILGVTLLDHLIVTPAGWKRIRL